MKIFDIDFNLDKINEVARIEFIGLLISLALVIIKKLSKYLKVSIPLWFSSIFNRRASVIARIHIILRKLLYRLEGDRASLFIFTGGEININNEDLLMTCTHEVTEDGIMIALNERRKLVVNSYGNFLKNLLEKEFIYVKEVPVNDNVSLSAFLLTQNTKQAYFKLVKNSENKIYGFICIEFCRLAPTEAKIKAEINSAKDKLILIIN